MSKRRILVVGAGGREHALAWRLARDPDRPEVLVAPGNAGTALDFPRVAVPDRDASALIESCRAHGVSLVVIGPEAWLADGVADALAAAGIRVFGPSAAAARIESSKAFAKQLMSEAAIPTARAESFDDPAAATRALSGWGPPWVIKADGLAGGKGVRVTERRAEAEEFVRDCLERGRFGDGGHSVLLEEFLPGEEATVIAVCDGRRFTLLPPARDWKRALDGDRGANTGGMGAVAPAAQVDAAVLDEVGVRVVRPLLGLMERRGTPFRGALYVGLMIGPDGPRVVEFNCRFGDPETQAIVPLLGGSLGDLLESAAEGRLAADAIERRPGAAVAVALVDEGYPETERAGEITGLDALRDVPDVLVFRASGAPADGAWKVTGGRVAYVVGVAEQHEVARRKVYGAIDRLGGSGWRCRRDIAARSGAATGGELARPSLRGV